jgi:hypothetical protein
MDATLYSVAFLPFLAIPAVLLVMGISAVAMDVADYFQRKG